MIEEMLGLEGGILAALAILAVQGLTYLASVLRSRRAEHDATAALAVETARREAESAKQDAIYTARQQALQIRMQEQIMQQAKRDEAARERMQVQVVSQLEKITAQAEKLAEMERAMISGRQREDEYIRLVADLKQGHKHEQKTLTEQYERIVADHRRQISNLEQRIDQLERKQKELAARLDAKTEALAEAVRQRDEAQNERDALRERLRVVERERDELTTQVESLQGNIFRMEARISALELEAANNDI